MMNRVNGAQGVKLLECTNPVKGKWRVRWDVHNNEDGSADYMEAEFNGKPSEDTIKTMVSEWFNDRTNETILSGFVWNGMSVWLSNENSSTTRWHTTWLCSLTARHCRSRSSSEQTMSHAITRSAPSKN